jgi:hypothetical protein
MDVDPNSQVEVEEEIRRLSAQLSRVTEEFKEAAMDEGSTEAEYKLAEAKARIALIGHEGTVDEKKAEALVKCEGQFRSWKTAEAVARAYTEAGRNIRGQLDALRSINANVRHSIDYAHGRGR